MPKDRLYRILIGLFVGALIVLVVVGYDVWEQIQDTEQQALQLGDRGGEIGGPFTLVDQDGRTVTEQDFAGAYMLIYFGFTYCPDVCPTELAIIAATVEELGAPDDVVPVFITIDPERDTSEAMADYVGLFHPRMVGLTGSEAQIAEAARAFRLFYHRAHAPEFEDNVRDHSSFVSLAAPPGRGDLSFGPG